MIETEQRLIQIGSSEGIILSKKDLVELGAKCGDVLRVHVELISGPVVQEKIRHEYDDFIEKYGQTLRNLVNR
jgi:hypothetical protein